MQPDLNRFTAKLAAGQNGALPDGTHRCTLIEVRQVKKGTRWQLIARTEGGRVVTKMLPRNAEPDAWLPLLGKHVSVKVWRRQGGVVSTSFSMLPGAVFSDGKTTLNQDGEIV